MTLVDQSAGDSSGPGEECGHTEEEEEEGKGEGREGRLHPPTAGGRLARKMLKLTTRSASPLSSAFP